MTTSASQGFTVVTTSGSSASWSGATNLKHSTDGTATSTITIGPNFSTKTLLLSVPNWASSIDAGSTLDSLTITYKAQSAITGSVSTQTGNASVTGGTSFAKSFGAAAFAWTTVTYTGDKDYWGWTSKTAQQALADILDGTVKFNLYFSVGGTAYSTDTFSVKDVEAQITYTIPSTSSSAATKGGAPLLVVM